MNGQRVTEIVWVKGHSPHRRDHLMLPELKSTGPARGRTVAVNAVPGPGTPPTVPGVRSSRRSRLRAVARRAGVRPSPCVWRPRIRPRTIIPYRTPPREPASDAAREGLVGRCRVILGLLFAGTVGVGLILLVAIAGRKGGTANASGTGAAVMKEAREATVKLLSGSRARKGPTARGGASPERVRASDRTRASVVSAGISRKSSRAEVGISGARLPGSRRSTRRAPSAARSSTTTSTSTSGGLTDGPSAGMLTTGQHDRPDAGRHAPALTPP